MYKAGFILGSLEPGISQGQRLTILVITGILLLLNTFHNICFRSTVNLGIRKVQFAPSKQGRQPCTVVRKDFMLSPGELELEVTLDKQLYHHGEKIAVNICIRNNSNKVVKKIKAMVQQGVDVVLFQNGQYRSTIASLETQ